jgi:flagellar assembly protein FliH
MAPRLIKQGPRRALSVQQFNFSEDPVGRQSSDEQPLWPDLPPETVNAAPEPPAPVETPKPETDSAQIEKNAYENGFLQGEKAGKEIAEQKVEAVMRRYADAIFEIGKLRSSLLAQVEREVVKLAVEISKKIIHREIQVDPDIIQTLVRVALSHVAEKSAVTIHLSPVDYNYLLEQRAELAQSEGRDISLLADKSIERGGCLVQTECGDIDARIEEKFREVEHAFFEDLK